MKRKRKLLSAALAVCFSLSLFSPRAGAADASGSGNGMLIDGLVPSDGIYYGGHTYLAFGGDFSWQQAKNLCELMGGYLVTLETQAEQEAVSQLATLGWTGACAFSGGNTRTWVWDHSGAAIGVMHEPNPDDEEDAFYYTPAGGNVWDPESNEPNSWRIPWDQPVAELNERGLNTLMPTDRAGFICEFDDPRVFSFVDLNFDQNFDFELDWGTNEAWAAAPASYDGLPRACSGFGKSNLTPEYPANAETNYNFKGYSTDKEGKDLWLGSEFALNLYDSVWYLGDTPLKKPIVTFYALWERAESAPGDLECFAASMFAYSKALEAGRTVSETLNLPNNLAWEDLDNDLPRFSGYGHVTMRDFINATIGGYVVRDVMRYDEGSTFSAVLLTNGNGQSILAYRGTEPSLGQSLRTDLLMGMGTLNAQFDHALAFYERHETEAPLLTGHSLGGALAAHVGVLKDVPCCTINSAQGFSLPLSLLRKAGAADAEQTYASFAGTLAPFLGSVSGVMSPDAAGPALDRSSCASFDEKSASLFAELHFYDYQPKLRSYASECDVISLPNRANQVFALYSGERVNAFTAHNIDRLIAYDEDANRYSIVPTTLQAPKAALESQSQGRDAPSSWAYADYIQAAGRGLVTPELDTSYQGEASRAEFCRAAVNLIETYCGKPIDTVLAERGLEAPAFSDTEDAAIRAAAALGITSGTDAALRRFSPDGQITREQAAVMLAGTLKALGADLDTRAVPWSDAHLCSAWAADAVNAVYNAGVMSGTSGTELTFSPKSLFTHEQTIITLNTLWNCLTG